VDRGANDRPHSALRTALASGRFVVTAEIGPPRGADPDAVTRKAGVLRGWVDAANITDNQSAQVRLSSLGGAVLALWAGVEPVLQLTCRDRNRIALQSDLISAAALGVPNVLLLTGDHPRFGDDPQATPVFDLDGEQLVSAARTMRDEGRLISGRSVAPAPSWLIGTVENPFAPPEHLRAARLAKKAAAGAEFAQTQLVFDVERFARWMADVRDLGVAQQCAVIAGVGPIRSLRTLEHLRTKVPGIDIPDPVVDRMRGVPSHEVANEGMRTCVETIQQLTQIDGVSGVHVMAFGFEEGIPEILEQAGVGPRSGVGSRAAGGDRAG
jgi:methylenetetrahydrofolate reductase (NADPH)